MANIIVIFVIALILTLSIVKIVRDKKKGVVCSGCSSCPVSGSCESPSHTK